LGGAQRVDDDAADTIPGGDAPYLATARANVAAAEPTCGAAATSLHVASSSAASTQHGGGTAPAGASCAARNHAIRSRFFAIRSRFFAARSLVARSLTACGGKCCPAAAAAHPAGPPRASICAAHHPDRV